MIFLLQSPPVLLRFSVAVSIYTAVKFCGVNLQLALREDVSATHQHPAQLARQVYRRQ